MKRINEIETRKNEFTLNLNDFKREKKINLLYGSSFDSKSQLVLI